jgi:hypothetical protein
MRSQHSFNQYPFTIIYLIICFHTQNFLIEILSASHLFVQNKYSSVFCSKSILVKTGAFIDFQTKIQEIWEEATHERENITLRLEHFCQHGL